MRNKVLFPINIFCVLLFSGIGIAGETGLTKEGKVVTKADVMEATPVHWKGRPILFCSERPFTSSYSSESLRLKLMDMQTGEFSDYFGIRHSLGCAFIEKDANGEDAVFHVFAAEQPRDDSWFTVINHFSSRDLREWTMENVLQPENENLLNSSVCRDADGYIMAYESNEPVKFCCKFARSSDLKKWEKIPDAFYAGPDGKTYSACPVLRWYAPYYYVIHLRDDHQGGYESALIRSKDLIHWEQSPNNPILAASEGEGSNNSDVDLYEDDGKTWLIYATGDQLTWNDIRRASFEGTEKEFFEFQFPEKESK